MTTISSHDQSKLLPSISTEVCIVGAGAAGITLAKALSSRGVKVTILEGGESTISGESQDLYRAEMSGLDYFDLTACRLRFLGGTTNHWGGYCRENDPIDYEPRNELGLDGWPVSYRNIRPYVEAAAGMLGINANEFDPTQALKKRNINPQRLLDSQSSSFETKVFLMARNLRFKDEFKSTLHNDKNVNLILRASATKLLQNSNSKAINGVVVKTLNGEQFTVIANNYILATHAIENARLLLVSNEVERKGIGNGFDHVGRYFMEHPHIKSGKFIASDKFPELYSLDSLQRLALNANLSLSRRTMIERRVLQYYCRFIPIYDFDQTEAALRRVSNGAFSPIDARMLKSLAHVTKRPLESFRAAAYRKGVYSPKPIGYELDHRIEQAPNPLSRVTLTDKLDKLGMPIAKLNWELNELDYRTFQVGQSVVVNELKRLGMGTFKLEDLTPELINSRIEGHYHHIGTTRMGMSEKDSVVDKNCRVHSVPNLYIAGSSVFPTSGYSGPTMMIVAFALRLADHLTNGDLKKPSNDSKHV